MRVSRCPGGGLEIVKKRRWAYREHTVIPLDTIADRLAGLSVAVIGDVCLDAYYFLHESDEVSVETGKRVRVVEKNTFDGGGAANLAINLKQLGVGAVELYGVVGADGYALILGDVLNRAGVVNRTVVQSQRWATNVYHKFYVQGVEEPRVDVGNLNRVDGASVAALLAQWTAHSAGYRVVILNQQIKNGFQTPAFRSGLEALRESTPAGALWLCDCRDLNDVYTRAIHKLNHDEALRIYRSHNAPAAEPSAEELAAWLAGHWKHDTVLTRGENGALVADARGVHEVLGVHIIHQVDAVGGGDAFLAAFAAALGAGSPTLDAAEVGNLAASVAVQKRFQTGHPTLAEIRAAAASTDFRYRPDLADNPLAARYLPGTPIEIIARLRARTPRIAIFDHDGTISTLRIGWETVMESMMLRAVVGPHGADLPSPLLDRVQTAVSHLIARTTGVQTLVQMHALVRLVDEFGFVPPADRLTPAEYKSLYNTDLLAMIADKVEAVRAGRLGVEDVTIKGAVAFLRRLKQAGVTLYLASGTDGEDVVREATLLGYADLFEGRIFGSTGNPDTDPKKLVFEQIFASLGGLPGDAPLWVFGDGPVELREGKKRGAVTVGITSDERQRHGFNPHKRARLVLAGADVLIPDFSWQTELLSLLGWNW